MAIGVFSAAAINNALIVLTGGSAWALMIFSVVAIYWLQPALPIRFSDFILPTFTLLLTVLGWWFTRRIGEPDQERTINQDRLAVVITLLILVGF